MKKHAPAVRSAQSERVIWHSSTAVEWNWLLISGLNGGGKRRHCRAISRGEVFIIVLSFHAAKLGLYFHICKFFSCPGRHGSKKDIRS